MNPIYTRFATTTISCGIALSLRSRKCILLVSLVAISMILTSRIGAAGTSATPPAPPREGWRFGGDLGVGDVDYDRVGLSLNQDVFYFALNASYFVIPQIRLGLETNGWLLESGNLYDTSEGEGISQPIMLTGHFYPSAVSDFYVRAGWGWSSYWNNEIGYNDSDSGTWSLGIGHDFRISDQWGWSPHLTYSSGDVRNVEYDAITLAVSFFWDRR